MHRHHHARHHHRHGSLNDPAGCSTSEAGTPCPPPTLSLSEDENSFALIAAPSCAPPDHGAPDHVHHVDERTKDGTVDETELSPGGCHVHHRTKHHKRYHHDVAGGTTSCSITTAGSTCTTSGAGDSGGDPDGGAHEQNHNSESRISPPSREEDGDAESSCSSSSYLSWTSSAEQFAWTRPATISCPRNLKELSQQPRWKLAHYDVTEEADDYPTQIKTSVLVVEFFYLFFAPWSLILLFWREGWVGLGRRNFWRLPRDQEDRGVGSSYTSRSRGGSTRSAGGAAAARTVVSAKRKNPGRKSGGTGAAPTTPLPSNTNESECPPNRMVGFQWLFFLYRNFFFATASYFAWSIDGLGTLSIDLSHAIYFHCGLCFLIALKVAVR